MPQRSLLAALLLIASAPGLADERAILVLDASGSMWQQVDGRSKVEIARDAVDGMLDSWNPESSLGLIAYGHRRRGDCEDIELLIAPNGFDRAAISRTVRGLNALGMTPITAAVRRAAEELRYTEQKATVILVSDGEETCKADPCALGQELEAQGIDFTAHVIGFDLPDGPARQQLECLATRTGGRYFDARDAGQLGAALGEIATAAPPPAARTDEGAAWIEGAVLEPDFDFYLDDAAPQVVEAPEFTIGQTARDCQQLCLSDEHCAAWHYEPAGSFFVEHPRCHRKNFGTGLALREEGEGFVAGFKPGAKIKARRPGD
jgi:Ca-activated chloride channel family protein